MEFKNLSISPSVKLELLCPDDFSSLWNLINKNQMFLSGFDASISEVSTAEKVKQLMARAEFEYKEQKGASFALKENGSLAGLFKIQNLNNINKTCSIGYWIGEFYTGRGLAHSTLKVLLQFCFNDLNLNRIEATTATSNQPSIRLLEKCGFKREGLMRQAYFIRGRLVDDFIYAILREDWQI